MTNLVHTFLDFCGRRECEGRMSKTSVTSHLCPKCRMDHIESFQILLVFVWQDVVHLLQPRERGVVATRSKGVKIGDYVVTLDYWVEKKDQVQQRLQKKIVSK